MSCTNAVRVFIDSNSSIYDDVGPSKINRFLSNGAAAIARLYDRARFGNNIYLSCIVSSDSTTMLSTTYEPAISYTAVGVI